MPSKENPIVREAIAAFVNHAFMFLDSKVLNADGIAHTLREFDPARFRGVFWRSNTGALKSASRFIKFGIPGSPDLIGFTRFGRFIGCECKTAEGTLSDSQKPFHNAMTLAGCIIFVARSYQDADAALAFHGL